MTTKPKPKNRHRLVLRKARLALKRRSPAAWRSAIDTILDPPLRVRVACTVWWDFFGPRTVDNRWPHLDDLVRPWRPLVDIDPEIVAAELVRLGYHPEIARARSVVRTRVQRTICTTDQKHTSGKSPERKRP